MADYFLVPTYVDALCLDTNTSMVEALVDYDDLPYIYGGDDLPYIYGGDVHGDPGHNLSEHILEPLFTENFTLKPGIHLHWSLPDALTQGEHEEDGTTFPQVPNRWLVMRRGGRLGERQWVIDSDYLFSDAYTSPQEPAENGDTVAQLVPINVLMDPPPLADFDPDDETTFRYRPFRYMGRVQAFEAWQSQEEGATYATALTAIGTKATVPIFDEIKATFAAFYPNCRSVFGFHDPEFDTTSPPEGLVYDVVGWYSDGTRDFLQILADNNPEATGAELLAILEEEYGWTCELADGASLPTRSLYFSRITFGSSAGRSSLDRVRSLPQPQIAVGNSPEEALSAYLAHQFPGSDDPELLRTVEEQLQALHFSESLQAQTLDIGAKFREARHESGFNTDRAGSLWAIMPEPQATNALSRGQGRATGQDPLPSALAHQLNQVNLLQEEYNQALLDIESMRRQGYAYWRGLLKGIKDVEWEHINNKVIIPLRTKIAQTGELDFTNEEGLKARDLCFGLVSKLSDYFSDYVDMVPDASDTDVPVELRNCGVHLTSSRTINIITENEEWEITEAGVVYPVKVEAGVLNFYVPPTATIYPQDGDGGLDLAAGSLPLAQRLVEALAALMAAIDTHNSGNETQYTLAQVPGQDYWLPNDPVVLLTGDSTKPPLRYGQDGRLRADELLDCHLVAPDWEPGAKPDPATVQAFIDEVKPTEGEAIGFIEWLDQPWNPFSFQWSVFAYPSREEVGSTVQDYDPAQILNHYKLTKNAIDFTLKSGSESSFVDSVQTYQGLSILTPAAALDLVEQIIAYLTDELAPRYNEENEDAWQDEAYFQKNWQDIKTWWEGQEPAPEVTNPISVSLWAYEQMQTLHCQAQMVGGFNDTLILAQPTLQLAIDDPLIPLESVEKFVHDQVRWTLGDSLQYRILDGDTFNPIRSGAMKLQQLWMVDTFGQVKKVVDPDEAQTAEVITTGQMTPPAGSNSNHQIFLPPRLVQPARLNFHWLAADVPNEPQIATDPGVNPVCGWFVPNNLDGTLSVYDAEGKSLGLIDQAGAWRIAPGSSAVHDDSGSPTLENQHLQKVVNYLLTSAVAFQQQFLTTINHSLETIDPAGFAQHQSLALLVGRPMALVRASFSLEVEGLAATNPTKSAVELPTTNGYEGVKFPIRLGDYQQLNDGLVGYWREVPDGQDYTYEGNIFYAPQSNQMDDQELIQTEAEGILYFEQTVDALPQRVTMLIDPRGTLHTTSGILPNQELTLPSVYYTKALQSLEVNFLSVPVLSGQGEIALPLPKTTDYAWSWLSLAGGDWSETTKIQPVNVKASFDKPQVLSEGWLQLTPAGGE